jgi:hypothetical protein
MNVDPVHASSAGVERQPAEKKLYATPSPPTAALGILRFQGKTFSFGHDREVRIRRGEKQWV